MDPEQDEVAAQSNYFDILLQLRSKLTNGAVAKRSC